MVSTGCGCNKSKSAGGEGEFMLIHPDGKKETFASKLLANQANRKIGSKGLVRPVR
jgi:hypothetical protein